MCYVFNRKNVKHKERHCFIIIVSVYSDVPISSLPASRVERVRVQKGPYTNQIPRGTPTVLAFFILFVYYAVRETSEEKTAPY